MNDYMDTVASSRRASDQRNDMSDKKLKIVIETFPRELFVVWNPSVSGERNI